MVSDSKSDVRKYRGFKSLLLRVLERVFLNLLNASCFRSNEFEVSERGQAIWRQIGRTPEAQRGAGLSRAKRASDVRPSWPRARRLQPETWRSDRVAEGARLEIVCTERYQGFESLLLRHFFYLRDTTQLFMVPGDATAVNPARSGRKQR